MDRFKFRFYDKQCEMYRSGGYYINGDKLMDDYYEDVYDLPDYMIVEQCTGLKDKNGNLIYEGDILLLRNNNFEVGHNGITVFFKCLTDEYIHIDPLDFDYNHSEIIGNVHEQKDNK